MFFRGILWVFTISFSCSSLLSLRPTAHTCPPGYAEAFWTLGRGEEDRSNHCPHPSHLWIPALPFQGSGRLLLNGPCSLLPHSSQLLSTVPPWRSGALVFQGEGGEDRGEPKGGKGNIRKGAEAGKAPIVPVTGGVFGLRSCTSSKLRICQNKTSQGEQNKEPLGSEAGQRWNPRVPL